MEYFTIHCHVTWMRKVRSQFRGFLPILTCWAQSSSDNSVLLICWHLLAEQQNNNEEDLQLTSVCHPSEQNVMHTSTTYASILSVLIPWKQSIHKCFLLLVMLMTDLLLAALIVILSVRIPQFSQGWCLVSYCLNTVFSFQRFFFSAGYKIFCSEFFTLLVVHCIT